MEITKGKISKEEVANETVWVAIRTLDEENGSKELRLLETLGRCAQKDAVRILKEEIKNGHKADETFAYYYSSKHDAISGRSFNYQQTWIADSYVTKTTKAKLNPLDFQNDEDAISAEKKRLYSEGFHLTCDFEFDYKNGHCEIVDVYEKKEKVWAKRIKHEMIDAENFCNKH